ncbi:PAS domain-containing sensor histidine kinase [Alicyclobacillus dauci]|uniref:histidine kinase n=1 Tax=Alicyclobacillus dauci TaxID=1475485 RepID=A0ABY6Z3Y8_9BACL|nr:PAS domain-containing sensor histidine kinase [Alicyclobacillus dauci]WAH36710.1 PAS domain S-box protein [Alicyclobacillus dauci]
MSTLIRNEKNLQVHRDVLESIYDGYYEVDSRARLVLLNSSLSEILNLPECELSGHQYMKHVSFSEARSLLHLFSYVWSTGQPRRAHEFQFERNDGKVLTLEASATLILDHDGAPVGMRGIIRNMSERKRVERARRESEQRYRSLFEHNTDAIIHFDLNGTIVDANWVTTSFVGYDPNELKGVPVDVFLSTRDSQKIRRAFAVARAGLSEEYEVNVRHRQGKIVRVQVRTVPIIVDGDVVGMYAICRDVTDQREAADALKRLSLQNKSILESAAEGICGVDRYGRTIFFNHAASLMTGFAPDEIIGTRLHDYMHHTHRDGSPHDFSCCPTYEAIHTGHVRKIRDDILWRKDGTWFSAEYVVSPMKENEEVTGAVIVFRDVTQQRQSEDLLLRSEKLSVVGELAAGIAHEIRNPLTALKGFVQLAVRHPETMHKYTDIMHAELERIETITTELLAFARPHLTQFKPTDIGDLVESVYALLSSQAILHGVNLNITFNHRDAKLFCEPDRIRQVLVNLLKNAIDALADGGTVYISTWEAKQSVFLAVRDTGSGMDDEMLKRVGEPFYTTKAGGTGLGIMVCQRIIASHHGRITWDSEIGMGTTVTIQLPRHKGI